MLWLQIWNIQCMSLAREHRILMVYRFEPCTPKIFKITLFFIRHLCLYCRDSDSVKGGGGGQHMGKRRPATHGGAAWTRNCRQPRDPPLTSCHSGMFGMLISMDDDLSNLMDERLTFLAPPQECVWCFCTRNTNVLMSNGNDVKHVCQQIFPEMIVLMCKSDVTWMSNLGLGVTK